MRDAEKKLGASQRDSCVLHSTWLAIGTGFCLREKHFASGLQTVSQIFKCKIHIIPQQPNQANNCLTLPLNQFPEVWNTRIETGLMGDTYLNRRNHTDGNAAPMVEAGILSIYYRYACSKCKTEIEFTGFSSTHQSPWLSQQYQKCQRKAQRFWLQAI